MAGLSSSDLAGALNLLDDTLSLTNSSDNLVSEELTNETTDLTSPPPSILVQTRTNSGRSSHLHSSNPTRHTSAAKTTSRLPVVASKKAPSANEGRSWTSAHTSLRKPSVRADAPTFGARHLNTPSNLAILDSGCRQLTSRTFDNSSDEEIGVATAVTITNVTGQVRMVDIPPRRRGRAVHHSARQAGSAIRQPSISTAPSSNPSSTHGRNSSGPAGRSRRIDQDALSEGRRHHATSTHRGTERLETIALQPERHPAGDRPGLYNRFPQGTMRAPPANLHPSNNNTVDTQPRSKLPVYDREPNEHIEATLSSLKGTRPAVEVDEDDFAVFTNNLGIHLRQRTKPPSDNSITHESVETSRDDDSLKSPGDDVSTFRNALPEKIREDLDMPSQSRLPGYDRYPGEELTPTASEPAENRISAFMMPRQHSPVSRIGEGLLSFPGASSSCSPGHEVPAHHPKNEVKQPDQLPFGPFDPEAASAAQVYLNHVQQAGRSDMHTVTQSNIKSIGKTLYKPHHSMQPQKHVQSQHTFDSKNGLIDSFKGLFSGKRDTTQPGPSSDKKRATKPPVRKASLTVRSRTGRRKSHATMAKAKSPTPVNTAKPLPITQPPNPFPSKMSEVHNSQIMSPFESKTDSAAMLDISNVLMQVASEEDNGFRKERVQSLAQAIRETVYSCKAAERSMWMAKQAAKDAEGYYEMTEASLSESRKLLEESTKRSGLTGLTRRTATKGGQ